MSFSRAFQWYHSHLDPIWPDGTFKKLEGHIFTDYCNNVKNKKKFASMWIEINIKKKTACIQYLQN